MMSKDRLVPVLKTNNRRLNFDFYVEQIGFTVLLEDARVASLGEAQFGINQATLIHNQWNGLTGSCSTSIRRIQMDLIRVHQVH